MEGQKAPDRRLIVDGLATEAGKQLLTQGVLGVLCLLLLAALVYVYREMRACDKARFSELERIIDARTGIEKALNANTLALEANNKASEARTRASEEIAREVAGLRQEVELAVQKGGFDASTITGKLDEMSRKIESLVHSLHSRGQS